MPTISLALGERSYDIHVENGALDRTGEFAYRAGLDGKIAVITDSCVAPLYAERVMKSLESAGFMPSLHVVNAGEASKNMLQAQELCSELVRAGLDRTGCIAALGGGVVGDLAGFIASIYYRGIPFMQIPTTVVAQVDSSVGGKTAVNIPEGKNLVGAFHQPSVVVIDPTTLVTLDRRTLAEGLAEAVKHAAIKDASMLHELKGLGTELSIGFSLNTITRLPDLISRNVAIKARIVENDELETLDIRALLNFGHTIGHGIEAVKGIKGRRTTGLFHGECVALGMLPMIESKALQKRVRGVYRRLGLPTRTAYNKEKVLAEMLHDKKAQDGQITIIKVPGLGCWRAETIPVEGLRPLLGMED